VEGRTYASGGLQVWYPQQPWLSADTKQHREIPNGRLGLPARWRVCLDRVLARLASYLVALVTPRAPNKIVILDNWREQALEHKIA
jgi:hypothetical protein